LATLKHAFLPKATLDRAQQLYMQIAQSDKRNNNDDDDDELPGGMVLLVWGVEHAQQLLHARGNNQDADRRRAQPRHLPGEHRVL
jgi:hypothetical protein